MRRGPVVALLAAGLFLSVPWAVGADINPVAADMLAAFDRWVQPRLTNELAPGGKKPEAAPVAAATPALREDKSNLAFQGMHVSIAVLDTAGKRLEVRPFNRGFQTGERFKLRVVSSFAGTLTIENINPKWQRKQVYPASGEVLAVAAGDEVLLPVAEDAYFQFAGEQGEEQLVVTVRADRPDGAAAKAKVYRQDLAYGANFVQQASFDASPDISGVVKLGHASR